MEDDDSNSNQNIGFYRLFVLCRRRRIWKMMIPTAIKTLEITDYLCCVCRRRRIWKMMIPTATKTLDLTDYLCCAGGGGYGR